MSNIINISAEKSKKFNILIFYNAKRLRKDAILVAKENKSYSSATSLLILSSEEAIKALLVLLHSEGFHVYKIEGAKKFFSDHKIRHNISKFIEAISGFVEVFNKVEDREATKLFNKNQDFWNGLRNGLARIIEVTKPIIATGLRINKLEEFNVNKNKGFYVDYKERLLIPTNEIGVKKYTETIEIIDRIFKTYKVISLLFNPQLKKHINDKELAILKEQLRNLVNSNIDIIKFN